MEKRRVLITGAAGRIGSYFARHGHERYDLRLMVRETDANIDAIRPFGEVVYGTLADLENLKRQFAGMDTIIHLAANADASATWGDLLESNIIGTYHVFAAAKAAGCRRVIFASSIHAISGYPPDVQVKTNEPVNPGDLYGVTKVFGEAMGRYMADQEGVSAIAIRIGAFMRVEDARHDHSAAMLDAFVSDRDLFQMLTRCVDDTTIRFALFHGLSGNRHNRMDITPARELLGYEPQDNLALENPHLKQSGLGDYIVHHNLKDDYARSGLRDEVELTVDS